MATNYRGGLRTVTLVANCRELRRRSTPAEKALWELIRSPAFLFFRFRRQHQFGSVILDFYCPKKRVAIELDGAQHRTPTGLISDKVRDTLLADQNIRVLRFKNEDALERPEQVLQRIIQALRE